MSYQLSVDGLSCGHCVKRVEKAVLAVDGVQGVVVSLEDGRAQVTGGKPEDVVAAVVGSGYQAHLT